LLLPSAGAWLLSRICWQDLPSILSQAVNVDIRSNRIAAGGVWIADGSAGVKMLGNTISQGEGPGVILGGLLGELNLPDREAGVVSVYIDDNTITLMRGSGISSTAEQERNFELGELEDVHIRGKPHPALCLKRPGPTL
jgi:hypothetical protein